MERLICEEYSCKMQPAYIPRMLHDGDELISEDELLAKHDVIIVLAEPGAGKTELLRSLAAKLAVEPYRASLFRHRDFPAPVQAIVIDALDEVAKVDLAAIDMVIEKARATKAAKVVLSSRSSEWDKARTRLVKECFLHDPATVHVQPFSEEEQEQLFNSYMPGEDFSHFKSEVVQFALDSLLGNPQFLKMFADAYVQRGRQFTSKRQIFVAAIEKLAAESSISAWQRDRPPIAEIVALADELFAKLMLSGASGISVSDEDDLDFPYLHALSMGDRRGLAYVLNTRLFKPTNEPSHHEPVHRIVAEYCAGRFLAERTNEPADGFSLRRLMSVVAPNGVVRDELRGLLGWFAALGNPLVQQVCIRTDPYAVLANGDPSQLAETSKRLLLKHLRKLSEVDPYFRRSDAWRRFSVAGFFTPDIVDDVRGLLNSEDTNPELLNLFLELLRGSDAVSCLEDLISALVLKQNAANHTRSRAAVLLVDLPSYNHETLVLALVANGDPGSLRVALEIVDDAGTGAVKLPALLRLFRRVVARAQDKGANTYDVARYDEDRFSISYRTKSIIAKLPLEATCWLLNELSRDLVCTCGRSRPHTCECLPGPSKVIGLLLDRYFELADRPHDPARIWEWTKRLVFNGHRIPQESVAVRALSHDHALRQAVHRLAFAGQTDDGQIWETRMRFVINTAHAGLSMQEADYFAISNHALETDNVPLWRGFYSGHRYCRENRGRDAYRAHLRRQSRHDRRFLHAWSKAERDARASPERESRRWLRRDRRRQRREERNKAALRQFYRDNKADIELGAHWGAVRQIADYYLFHPNEMSELVDDPHTATLALRNSFAMLDPHVPSLSEIEQRYEVIRVLYAACLATYREEGDLNNVGEKVLRAVKTAVGVYPGVGEEETKTFEAEIDHRLFANTADVEAYARELIEPQLLRSDNTHTDVGWLRYKDVFKPLQKTLPLEWLSRYPNMPDIARDHLFDMCAEHADRVKLNRLIQTRCTEALDTPSSAPSIPGSVHDFWLLRGFFFLPEPPTGVLAYLRGNPQTIFGIEHRAGSLSHKAAVGWPALSAAKIFAILDAYVDAWPKVFLPSSFGTGSPAGEIAYRFLTDIVYSVGRDDPVHALPVIDKLLADSRFVDFHTVARSLKAHAIRKHALQGFLPPTPRAVVELLDRSRIATVEDLRAILIEELEEYQIWLRNAETAPLSVFYSEGRRVSENVARDRIVDHLDVRMRRRDLSIVVEHHVANANRCDFTVTAMVDGQRRLLVVEMKGQWHPELFSAASAQLHDRYSTHPDAAMQGVYLVLWVGGGAKIAGRVDRSMATPMQLHDKLTETMPPELHGSVDVFVLNLSPT